MQVIGAFLPSKQLSLFVLGYYNAGEYKSYIILSIILNTSSREICLSMFFKIIVQVKVALTFNLVNLRELNFLAQTRPL